MAFNLTPATLLNAANSLQNLLTSFIKTDIVAVLNQETMRQVFEGARPVKAFVKETAKVMDYPVETGSTLSDHRVSNPTEIEIQCIISSDQYATAYQQIRNAWLNATKLSVQCRTGTYRNMIISDLPHAEDPDMFNAINQFIRLREVILVAPSSVAPQQNLANYSPTDPQNAMMVNRGLLNPVAAAGSILGYFHAKTIWGL